MNSLIKNFRIIRYVFRFCPFYALYSALFILASIVNSVLKVFLIEQAIDMVLHKSPQSEIFLTLGEYLIAIVITTLIRSFYQGHISGRYRTIYVQKIQQTMYSRTKSIDYPDFDNPEFYDQYSRALRDGSARGIRVYEDLVNFVSSSLNTFAIGTIIFISDWKLIAIILVASVCSVFFNIINNKLQYKLDKDTEKNRRMYYYINRTFYQQKYAAEIKTTPISNLLIDKYKDTANIINREYIKTHKKMTLFMIFSNIASILIEQGGSYWFLTAKLFAKEILLDEFASVLNASLQFSGNFVSMIFFITRVKVNALYIDDFLWYMNYQPKIEKQGNVRALKPLEEIVIEDLYFRYPNNENYSLENLSLKIRKGEKLAIVGLNGAGKTTLIKLLLKFYSPSEGKIAYNSLDYNELDETQVRNQYSIVFQDFQIYALSIAENILMRKAETEEDERIVWDSLKKVGLDEKVRLLPDTIYTMVTREFDDLGVVFSGGERQKLVIARVFVSNASILVLDEPTASLDPFGEKAINDLIIENSAQKTIIIIAHRLSTVVDVNHIILIENGKIIESGTHQELMEQNGMYCKMFNTQASLYKKSNN